MRRLGTLPLFILGVLFTLPGPRTSQAVIPIRMYDVNGVIEKVTPPTDAEKEAGVLVTIQVKGRDKAIQVTKTADLHRQAGKLVPVATADEIKAGKTVSVWLSGKTDKAEAVLIFP
jgi:hypothetical protein